MPSHRMQIAAMCVCALVCMYHVTALTKLTAKEATLKVAHLTEKDEEKSHLPLEKAVLSDLYLRKGEGKYTKVSGKELICSSRHRRTDKKPCAAVDRCRWHSYVSRSTYVEAELRGRGLWKRYDGKGTKVWAHAKLDSGGVTYGIIKMAAKGKIPKDEMKHYPMAAGWKNKLLNAVTTITGYGGISSTSQDNYISVPIGEHNNHIFSPGLNQLWIVFNSGRNVVVAHVVVGSKADDDAVAYYVGADEQNGFLTLMTQKFTIFSHSTNPMVFTLELKTVNGNKALPQLEMDIRHFYGNLSEERSKYIIVLWSCWYYTNHPVYADGVTFSKNWKERTSSIFTKGWTQILTEFAFFREKGAQIWDLCHCYTLGSSAVTYHNCLMEINKNPGESMKYPGFEGGGEKLKLMNYLAGLLGDRLFNAKGAWLKEPEKIVNGKIFYCWDDHYNREFYGWEYWQREYELYGRGYGR